MIDKLTDIKEVADYLMRIGAEPRSLRTAVVREIAGKYWRDIAVIRFRKDGEIDAPEQFIPTEEEAAAIKEAFTKVQFPEVQPLGRIVKPPKVLKAAAAHNIYQFKDLDGRITMIQVRIEEEDGGKRYIPLTYWTDGKWRIAEPEGLLPLWGIDQLNDHTTVFIHEGAKAANACRVMVEAKTKGEKDKLSQHPWGDELASAAHIGWIGGALSPARTDWSILAKAGVKRAYIVSDNDAAGLSAVPAIAYQLRMPTFHIQFTNEWPASFDLADSWPSEMFREIDEQSYYIGPSFKSCLHPATWATDQVPNKKGKPSNVLRENFKDMWAYVEEADLFVCLEIPEIVRTEQIMNNMLSSFSHAANTSKLMLRDYRGRYARLCYRPDEVGKLVTEGNSSAINLHTPTHIKPVKGNPKPFLNFMAYLFPKEEECNEVLRWCATLISCPEVRMEYGLLLVSEAQGVGKTTLGSYVLAPLVGHFNVSYPSETSIVQSEFNEWMANKRLVVVNEIYSGHSWKAYQKLKSVITDRQVEVNQKYQRTYTIDNWCHILACSNSMRALRMEEDDRRWYYPEVTEASWARSGFASFYNWLGAGGLSIIHHWAFGFGDYIKAGQRAPLTNRKQELIASSRTEAQAEAHALAEAMMGADGPVAMAMKEVVAWVRSASQGKVHDTDYELRKAMKSAGATVYSKRFNIGGRMQYIILNGHNEWNVDVKTALVKKHLRRPNEILEEDM